MDDSSPVETEHVEKITRTPSVPQLTFENSVTHLDETEFYDVDLPDQSKDSNITVDDSVDGLLVSESTEVSVSFNDEENYSEFAGITRDVDGGKLEGSEADRDSKEYHEVDVKSDGEHSEEPLSVNNGHNHSIFSGVTSDTDIDGDLAAKPEESHDVKEDLEVVNSQQVALGHAENGLSDQQQVANNNCAAEFNVLLGDSALDDNANPKRSSLSGAVSNEPVATDSSLKTGIGENIVASIVEDVSAIQSESSLQDQVQSVQDNVHNQEDFKASREEGTFQSNSSETVAALSSRSTNEIVTNCDAHLAPVSFEEGEYQPDSSEIVLNSGAQLSPVVCKDDQFSLKLLSDGSGGNCSNLINSELETVEQLITASEAVAVLAESLVSSVSKPEADRSVLGNCEDTLTSAPAETSSTIEACLDDAESQSLQELCNSIKEPEDLDHKERCSLENNEPGSRLEEASVEDESEEGCWSQLLGNDNLKKLVIKRGDCGKRRPFNGQLVTIRCSAQLLDGTAVDQYDSLSLILGDADFIEAFDVCICRMRVGEICRLFTDAQYAYGSRGREPDIPKNASLTYEIELKNVENVPPFFNLPIKVRIQLSNLKRERGNFFYSINESRLAIEVYAKALKIVDDSSESHGEDSGELQMLLDARVKCHNNLAAALLKVEAWDAALVSINHVLRVQPENVKALFRKGKCLISKGEHETAIPYLQKAAKLEPETKIIQQELARLEKWTAEQKKSQKAMYKKMLGDGKKCSGGKNEKSSSSTTWWWYGAAMTAIAVAASLAMYRRFGHS